MMKSQPNMRVPRRTRGFTLLEVLIVAGILALLAAFVVPNLLGAGKEARINLAKAAVGRSGPLASSINKFHVDVSKYPEALQDLVTQPSYIETSEDGENPWKGPYIEDSKMLKDPWQKEFQYKAPGDVNEDSYDLWSMGPDMKEGTEDDITNWTKK